MRKGIIILLLFVANFSYSQNIRSLARELLGSGTVTPPTIKSFTIDTINIAANVDTLAPARGANSFYGATTPNSGQAVQIPIAGQNQIAYDDDTRMTWQNLQPTSAGVYNWATLDAVFHNAIDLGKKQSTGLVTVCVDCGDPIVGGSALGYPVFVHNAMQGEANPDWSYTNPNNGSKTWIPNWNSPSYLNNLNTFLQAFRDHINTTSYKGVPYTSVVYKIDIRGMGDYGEWHFFPWINCGCIPANTMPTQGTLQSIVDMYKATFPNTWLIGNINMLVDNNMPAAFGYYFLTQTNNFGPFGIRSDHLGDIGAVNFDTIVLASRTVSGLNFKTAYYTRYVTSPMNGEPINDANSSVGSCGFSYCDLDHEVRNWHLSQFSNVSSNTTNQQSVDMFRTASKSCGYKVKIRGGTVSDNVASGNPIQVKLFWANTGYAPIYENWTVQILLRNAGGVVAFTGQSTFVLRLFQPLGNTVVSTDNFSLPGLPAGVYKLEVIVVDPLAYRKPFPLYQKNLVTGGSYLLTTINII